MRSKIWASRCLLLFIIDLTIKTVTSWVFKVKICQKYFFVYKLLRLPHLIYLIFITFNLLKLIFIFIALGKHFSIFFKLISSSEFSFQQFFFKFVSIFLKLKYSFFNNWNVRVLLISLNRTLLFLIYSASWLWCGLSQIISIFALQMEILWSMIECACALKWFCIMMIWHWNLRTWNRYIREAHATLVLMEIRLASMILKVLNLTALRFLDGILITLWLSLENRLATVMISLRNLKARSRKLYVTYSIILRARHLFINYLFF